MPNYETSQLIELGDIIQIKGLTNAVQYNNNKGVIIKIGDEPEPRLTIELNSFLLPSGSKYRKVRVKTHNLIFIGRKTNTNEPSEPGESKKETTSTNQTPEPEPEPEDEPETEPKDETNQTTNGVRGETFGIELEQETVASALKYLEETNQATKDGIKEAYYPDRCCICLTKVPLLDTSAILYSCCGKLMHANCCIKLKKSNNNTKNKCPLCRAPNVSAESQENIDRLKKWSESGESWAQFNLGGMYDQGIGVKQDDQKAFKLFHLAAKQGHCQAQFNLGNMYDKGQGCERSDLLSFKYWKLAAEQGIVNAQFNIGNSYINGQGVDQCAIEARKWWGIAASQGVASAITNLKRLDELEQKMKEAGDTEFSITSLSYVMTCSKCNKPQTKTHKLNNCGCKAAKYCNATCQRAHWEEHKTEHRRLRKELENKTASTTLQQQEIKSTKTTRLPNLCKTSTTKKTRTTLPNLCKTSTTTTTTTTATTTPETEKQTDAKEVVEDEDDGMPQLNWKDEDAAQGVEVAAHALEKVTEAMDEMNDAKDNTNDAQKTSSTTSHQEETKEDSVPPGLEDLNEEFCPICHHSLPQNDLKYKRMTKCCGQGIHYSCIETHKEHIQSMTTKTKEKCVSCLASQTDSGTRKQIDQIHAWIAQGKDWAMFTLAEMCSNGEGEVPQSWEQAAHYYTLAAEKGHISSMAALGSLYLTGRGFKGRNINKGKAWFLKAAELGHVNAIGNLKRIDRMQRNATPSFVPEPRVCAYCSKSHNPLIGINLTACTGCRNVFYCSKQHQRDDWKLSHASGHKKMCEELTVKKKF